ncbi:MAG: BamA/TamA family outer membrane protein [Flavobacteriales bacterium]|nr:BamA/TamA family outer membrane protein [Flavobacteriales bacterium]
MRIRPHSLLFPAAVLLVLACNSTKWVPPGERLLVHNSITVEPQGSLTVDELEPILKQKPNKRVLGRALYLDFYNLRDPGKVARKRARKDSLCEVRNLEIRAKDSTKVRECDDSLRDRSGEAPVLLDTSLVQRTVAQLRNYAFKEGWFAAQVSDTIRVVRRRWPFGGWSDVPYKKPKANVQYVVRAGRPWTICTLDHRVDDPALAAFLREDSANSFLKPGDRFDGDVVDAERARITKELKILGYLYFTKDMVIFDADTSVGDHEVDLVLRLERPLASTQRGLRGTPEGTWYDVNDVFIDASLSTEANALLPYDTLRYEGFTLLYRGRRSEFRPRPLTTSVLLKPSARFNQNDADRTFRRLTNLRVFDRVEITYDTTGLAKGLVNGRVSLLPSKRQGISLEGFGTNRGGFLGTALNFTYKHKNVFRTMTFFQASVSFGFEAQQRLTSQSASEDASTAVGKDALFNTIEIGPEVKIGFPTRWGSAKTGGTKAVVNGLFNYQKRQEYQRTLAKGSAGIEGSSSWTHSWGFYPVEVNRIRITDRSDAFSQFLAEAQDTVLSSSYQDQTIVGWRGNWTWNTQTDLVPHRRNWFLRISGEWMGTVVGPFIPVRWLARKTTDPNTGEHYHELGDIRYAEYAKVELDLRRYIRLHERSSIAFRGDIGAAKPYGNRKVMPFETSFFSGGANGMRAWRARSLGPGAYQSEETRFDRIGEIRIEGNAEYRFKLVGYLEGALFSDVGNTWYLQRVVGREAGQFRTEKFLSEIAVGTGVGARLNFDFFLVRFDLALQTKDPSLPTGQRWIFQKKDADYVTDLSEKLNFNLGIGYPF